MLHRFLNREDDAFRSAGLLASAFPAPSRLRSGVFAGVSWPLQQHVCPGFAPGSHLPGGVCVRFPSRPTFAGHLRGILLGHEWQFKSGPSLMGSRLTVGESFVFDVK